jgi:hypothetical protein
VVSELPFFIALEAKAKAKPLLSLRPHLPLKLETIWICTLDCHYTIYAYIHVCSNREAVLLRETSTKEFAQQVQSIALHVIEAEILATRARIMEKEAAARADEARKAVLLLEVEKLRLQKEPVPRSPEDLFKWEELEVRMVEMLNTRMMLENQRLGLSG